MSEPAGLKNTVSTRAREAGFDEAGITPLPHPAEERDASRLDAFLDAGYAGSMQWLDRRDADGRRLRTHPQLPYPWARSVIVCSASYHADQPLSVDAAAPDAAWIARYAWSGKPSQTANFTETNLEELKVPSDYHKVLLKRLRTLEANLQFELGPFESRAYVDTGPVVERSLAVAAGLGWTGKNTCLIHPARGSFNFLAVILTSLEISELSPPLIVPDRCGSCQRCIEACPTQALIEPYKMDATRCISYLTIEHHGSLDENLMSQMGRQVFGCDICQDVCPWNRKAPIGIDPELSPRAELVNPAVEWLASLDEREFERRFNGSPVRRAGFSGLRRNLAVAMGNTRLSRFAPRLCQWAQSADEGLRTAAEWALTRLNPEK